MTAGISTRSVQLDSRVRLQALTAQIPGYLFLATHSAATQIDLLASNRARPHHQISFAIEQNFIHHSVISFHDTTARFHQLLPFTFFCRNLWRKSDLFIWSFALKQKTLQRRDDFKFKSHVKRMTERHSGAEINSRYHHLRRWTTKSCIIVCLHSENRRQATWIYYARCFSRFTADN